MPYACFGPEPGAELEYGRRTKVAAIRIESGKRVHRLDGRGRQGIDSIMRNLTGRLNIMAKLTSIRVRLVASFALLAAITVTAVAVAWLQFGLAGDMVSAMQAQRLPVVNSAFQLARHTQDLNRRVFELAQAPDTENQSDAYLALMDTAAALDEEMFEISDLGGASEAKVEAMLDLGASLTTEINALNALTGQRLKTQTALREEQAKLRGYEQKLPELTEGTPIYGRAMNTLVLLQEAATARDVARIAELEQRYNGFVRNLINDAQGVPGLSEEVWEVLNALIATGASDMNIFAAYTDSLNIANEIDTAVEQTVAQASLLDDAVNAFVEEARASVEADSQATMTQIDRAKFILALMGFAALLVSGTLGYFYVMRNLNARLTNLASVMRKVADGNLDIAVPTGGRDEISGMAAALQTFKENGQEMERLRAEQAEMEERARQERVEAMQVTANNLDTSLAGIIGKLAQSAERMESTAGELTEAARASNDETAHAATGADDASANVQAMASAMTQMSNSIRDISQQINKALEIARTAGEEAEATSKTVNGMRDAAAHIGEVVTLINDIASQTNLLALNATIESARAGDAGKGFAVVASEVKQLAGQTAKATEEIGKQIDAVQGVSNEAAAAMQRISSTIQSLNDIAATVASAAVEQDAAVQEISENAKLAASGTASVSKSLQGVKDSASRTGTAADEVRSASGELTTSAASLKAEIAKVLETLRAA